MGGTPMAVSISLAMYIAERNTGIWKDKFITFSYRPEIQTIVGKTIGDRIRNLYNADWAGNTDLIAVFESVLNAGIKNNVPDAEMPKKLIIVSDMQFDQASERGTFVIDEVKRKFQDHGLVMPKLILWNLRASGTNTFAADKDTKDVGILSGFSQSVFKAFMSGCNFELMTPMYLLKEALHVARYDVIANCAK
jgi:hypothetical protein